MDANLLLEQDGLFHTEFPDGTSFLWKLLSLEEYSRFSALRQSGAIHSFILYTTVFNHCLIGNPHAIHNDLPAGIPIAIGEAIMWLSGDSELTTLAHDIDSARQYYPQDSVKEAMKRVIFMAWPSYKEEDLGKLSYPALIKRFVVAEHLLIAKGAEYQPFDTRKIHGPGEAAKKKNAVDFRKENSEMKQAMGDDKHMLDRSPGEMSAAASRNKGRMKRQIARNLDRRK